MNSNPRILAALDGIGVPVEPVVYQGRATSYITFYSYYESSELYADDEEVIAVERITVDVWSKGNYKPLLNEVKARMKNAGFTYVDIGPELYEPERELFHRPINFEIEGEP